MNPSLTELRMAGEQPTRSCAPGNLEEILDYLHLPVALKNYKSILASAGKDNLSHHEFLLRLLSQESCAKFERQIQSRSGTLVYRSCRRHRINRAHGRR